jgi:hypothetical protein
MMHIDMQPEPPHFFETVRKKGEEFLLQNPGAKGKKLKPFWKKIIPDLHTSYSGICAYTCHWIPNDTGSVTVEHFKPKEVYPQYAYCWDNYRLVCGTLNGRKGTFEDVLDPFTLQDGWFILHFPSLQLCPGEHLTSAETEQVKQTIKRLKLNDWTCIRGRQSWLTPYLSGKYDMEHLKDMAPFLARELQRQGFADRNHAVWKEYRERREH